MRSEFDLTPNPITLTGPTKMVLSAALETSEFESILAILQVLTSAGTTYTVRLLGGMSRDSEDGWFEILTWGAQTPPAAATTCVRGDKVAKYLRWEVTGNFTLLVFTVKGFLQAQ